MYRNPKILYQIISEKFTLVEGYDYKYQELILKGYTEIYPERMMMLGLLDNVKRDSNVDVGLIADVLKDVLLDDASFRERYNKFLEDFNIKIDTDNGKSFYDTEFAKLIQQCFSLNNPVTKYDYLCCKVARELDCRVPSKPKFRFGDFSVVEKIGDFKAMLDEAASRISEDKLELDFKWHFDAILRELLEKTTGFINYTSLDRDVFNKMVDYLKEVMGLA